MSNAIQHEYASYGYATDGSLALRPKSHTFVVIPGLASDPVDDWSEKGKDICGESEGNSGKLWSACCGSTKNLKRIQRRKNKQSRSGAGVVSLVIC